MTDASDAVIVTAVRTPIGRSGRSLAGLSLQDIGMQTVAGAIAAAGLDPGDIDDLLLGEVLQGGGCTARYVANALGLPPDTPGGAVQRQCATGMMAVQEAAANIRSGMADAVIAGGVESMTRSPLLFEKSPFPFGGVERFIPPSHPNMPDAPNTNMLITVGENTARECGITRRGVGRLVVPLQHPGRGRHRRRPLRRGDHPGDGAGGTGRDGDGQRRRAPAPGHHTEKLAALPSLTGPDGQITAGNSSASPTGAPPWWWWPAPTPRPTGWSRWRRCGRGTRAALSRPAPGWRRRCASPGP